MAVLREKLELVDVEGSQQVALEMEESLERLREEHKHHLAEKVERIEELEREAEENSTAIDGVSPIFNIFMLNAQKFT